MLMVGDPCYFLGKDATIHDHCKDWKQACKDIFCAEKNQGRDAPMDIYGLLQLNLPYHFQ